MNEVPPKQDPPEDVDDHYRRASALDASRPSESVRQAVLGYAARLAKHRLSEKGAAKLASRQAVNQTWRRPAIFGIFAAAALAGLLITPRFFVPSAPPTATSLPAQVSPLKTAAPPAPPAPQAELTEPLPETMADGPPPSALSADTRGQSELRSSPRDAAPIVKSPAEFAASNAPAETRSADEVRNSAAPIANSPAEIAAKNAPAKAQSAAGARSAATVAPAAQLTDPAAALRHAAETGDIPQLQMLLGKPHYIDVRDDSGRTALMLATLHGQIRAADLLLAQGADPNAVDGQGTTPLQAAVAGHQHAIAAALRSAGAR